MFKKTWNERFDSIVVVFGGRDFDRRRALFARMDKFHARYHFNLVVSGGAEGADKLAIEWAEERGIACREEPAQWTNFNEPCLIKTNRMGHKYNALAGPNRNQFMIDKYQPNYAVEFPGGYGTMDMHDRVQKAVAKGIIKRHIVVKRKAA